MDNLQPHDGSAWRHRDSTDAPTTPATDTQPVLVPPGNEYFGGPEYLDQSPVANTDDNNGENTSDAHTSLPDDGTDEEALTPPQANASAADPPNTPPDNPSSGENMPEEPNPRFQITDDRALEVRHQFANEPVLEEGMPAVIYPLWHRKVMSVVERHSYFTDKYRGSTLVPSVAEAPTEITELEARSPFGMAEMQIRTKNDEYRHTTVKVTLTDDRSGGRQSTHTYYMGYDEGLPETEQIEPGEDLAMPALKRNDVDPRSPATSESQPDPMVGPEQEKFVLGLLEAGVPKSVFANDLQDDVIKRAGTLEGAHPTESLFAAGAFTGYVSDFAESYGHNLTSLVSNPLVITCNNIPGVESTEVTLAATEDGAVTLDVITTRKNHEGDAAQALEEAAARGTTLTNEDLDNILQGITATHIVIGAEGLLHCGQSEIKSDGDANIWHDTAPQGSDVPGIVPAGMREAMRARNFLETVRRYSSRQ